MNNGFNSFLFYHSSDSISAFKNSNNYCISNDLNIDDRICVNLDNVPQCQTTNNVLFLDKYILIENYLILDLTKQLKSNLLSENIIINMIYVNKYTFKNLKNDMINAKEIIVKNVNDIDFSQIKFRNHSSKIYSLSNGAREIKL